MARPIQTQDLPNTYNRDEVERKLDLDRRLTEQDKKLDELLLLLKGQGADNPGISHRVKNLERVVYGSDSTSGLATKTAIMWRAHVWLLCTMSAATTLAVREIVRYIWKV